MDSKKLILPKGYAELLERLKGQIRQAQIKASVSVNKGLILLYWNIGKEILQRQQQEGWGTKVIDRLSADLKHTFPEMTGFSSRNLKYMRAFAAAYPEEEIVQEVLAQIPWYHNITLLDKAKEQEERLWYVHKTVENGWSRSVLVHQIEGGLYRRQGQALTNFPITLPAPQSELAQNLLKDPFTFDFLTLAENAKERDLERSLLAHIRDFLLELGRGFAFLGSQYNLEVGGEDFYLDLLFYHTILRCHIVIDLKIGAFKPEYAGKMGFYLTAVDEQLRHSDDHPPIGIILCKERNKVVVEYALRDTTKPMAVATYQLTEKLPKDVRGNLPSIEELETELRKDEDD